MSKAKALRRIVTPNDRQVELVRLIVNGLDWGDTRLDKPAGVPLTIDEAAALVGLRARYARQLMAQPAMQAQFKSALADRRGQAQPKALAALEAIVQATAIVPKASDVVAAAKAILGDDEPRSGLSVNVAVNNQLGVSFRPGYVIRLPASEPKTIEHQG